MKALFFAVLILLFALPARAQGHASHVGSPASPMINGGGGGAGGGYGSVSFPASASSAPVHYQYTFAHGSESGFVPSRFVRYEDAVKMGQAAALATPPTPVSIAEVAAEYRALKQRQLAQ
jgi:hypothetical protein